MSLHEEIQYIKSVIVELEEKIELAELNYIDIKENTQKEIDARIKQLDYLCAKYVENTNECPYCGELIIRTDKGYTCHCINPQIKGV